MAEAIRIIHEDKSYELVHKKVTGALLEQIRPIRNLQVALSQQAELIELALSDDELFTIIDPRTGGQREGIEDMQLVELAKRHKGLIKALNMPTVRLTTDSAGLSLAMQMLRLTVDRSKFSKELCAALDSDCGEEYRTEEDVTLPATDEEPEKTVARSVIAWKETSEFWKEFDVLVLIQYVETFCGKIRW